MIEGTILESTRAVKVTVSPVALPKSTSPLAVKVPAKVRPPPVVKSVPASPILVIRLLLRFKSAPKTSISSGVAVASKTSLPAEAPSPTKAPSETIRSPVTVISPALASPKSRAAPETPVISPP